MKKRWFLGILGAASIAILASCGGKSGTIIDSTGNWNGPQVEANIEPEEEAVEERTNYNYSNADLNFLNSDEIYNTTYANYGLLVMKNTYNNIGFYSLAHGKYLLNKRYSNNILDYNVTQDQYVGFILRVHYDDVYQYYDSLGNVIIESDNSNVTIQSSLVNKNVYLTVRDEATEYYQYLAGGSLAKVEVIPQVVQENNNNDTPKFNAGSQYVDIRKTDLADYGVSGYYLSHTGNLVTVFEESTNTPKSTFTLPQNARAVLVGKKIIYQTVNELSDDAIEYSYYSNAKKYEIVSKSVDIMTGQKSTITLNYLIAADEGPYKDKDNKYKYTICSVNPITPERAITAAEVVLLDETGNAVSNLDGYSPLTFTKVGNSLYNSTTKVLYTKELKEIAYLGAINPVLLDKSEAFVGSINGKYGVLDTNGKVIVAFEYTNLYHANAVDGYFFGVKNNTLYRIKISAGAATETRLGEDYTKVTDYLYIIKNNNTNFSIESTTGSLKNVSANRLSRTFAYNSYFASGVVFDFITNTGSVVNGVEQTTHSFYKIYNKKAPNADSYVAPDSEIYSKILLGETEEEAVTLTETKNENQLNKVYITSGNGNYYKFKPTVDGYYTFSNDYKDYNVNYNVYYYNDTVQTNVYGTNETFGKVYALSKDDTYYIKISSSYTSKGTIFVSLKKEDGERSSYPLFAETDTNLTLNKHESDYTYVLFNIKSTGKYEIYNPDNLTYSFQTYNGSSYSIYDKVTINGKDYMPLQEFKPLLVRFSNFNKSTATFALKYSTDTSINAAGISQANAIPLNGNITADTKSLTYFEIENTTDLTKTVKFSTDLDVSKISVYLDEYTSGKEKHVNSITNGGILSVPYKSKLVFRYYNSNQSNTIRASISARYIELSDTTVTSGNYNEFNVNRTARELTVTSSGLYYFTVQPTTSGIAEDAEFSIYDLYDNLYFSTTLATAKSFAMYLESGVKYKAEVKGLKNSEGVRLIASTSYSSDSYQQIHTGPNRLYAYYSSGSALYYYVEVEEEGYYGIESPSGYNSFTIYKETPGTGITVPTTSSSYTKYALLTPGVYYIKFSSYSGSSVDTYKLNMERGSQSSYPVVAKAGTNTLDSGVVRTYFEFTPEESGTYTFTLPSNYELISYGSSVTLSKTNNVYTATLTENTRYVFYAYESNSKVGVYNIKIEKTN